MADDWAKTIVEGLITAGAGVVIARATVWWTERSHQSLADLQLSRTMAGELLEEARELLKRARGGIYAGQVFQLKDGLERWEQAYDLRGRVIKDKELLRRLDRYTADMQELLSRANLVGFFRRTRYDGRPLEPGDFDSGRWSQIATDSIDHLQQWIEDSLIAHQGRVAPPADLPSTHWPTREECAFVSPPPVPQRRPDGSTSGSTEGAQ